MSRLIDETRNRYGRLVVIEREANNSKSRSSQWKCLCDCGKYVTVRGICLRRKNCTKSCGCLAVEKSRNNGKKFQLPTGEAARNKLYKSYERSKAAKKFSFTLTKEEFTNITRMNCYYCNSKPMNITKGKKTSGNYTYNGIDRVDNSVGYILSNCVPCCKNCNSSKNSATILIARKMIEFINRQTEAESTSVVME